MSWAIGAYTIGACVIIVASYLLGYCRGIDAGCKIGMEAMDRLKDGILESIKQHHKWFNK